MNNYPFNSCPVCNAGLEHITKSVEEEKVDFGSCIVIIKDYIVYHCNVCKEGVVDKDCRKRAEKVLTAMKEVLKSA